MVDLDHRWDGVDRDRCGRYYYRGVLRVCYGRGSSMLGGCCPGLCLGLGMTYGGEYGRMGMLVMLPQSKIKREAGAAAGLSIDDLGRRTADDER